MEKKTKNFVCGIVFTILAIAFTILIKFVDVQAIGPENSAVGFATLNGFIANVIGSNMSWYHITEILGLAPLMVVVSYALIGVVQLIKRRSLLKVDNEIISLGIFYVILAIIYVFFEKCIINYRPILIDGVLEASYPSSHTMLAIFVCVSAMIVNKNLIKNTNLRKGLEVLLTIIGVTIVFGRVISGVHWCTDIIAGGLFSIALIEFFETMYTKSEKE